MLNEDVTTTIEGIEVLTHDASVFLLRALDDEPAHLRGELRRIRAMLVDALDLLDREALPLAETLYNAAP